MYFVYFLYCPETGYSYVGQTSHLLHRYRQHRIGEVQTTRRMKRPVCIYWEAFPTRAEAMRREKFYKSGRGHEIRTRIIADNRPLVASAGSSVG